MKIYCKYCTYNDVNNCFSPHIINIPDWYEPNDVSYCNPDAAIKNKNNDCKNFKWEWRWYLRFLFRRIK